AEDGIRVPLVTGVQTCALPICQEPRDPIESNRPLAQPRGDPRRLISRRLPTASRDLLRLPECYHTGSLGSPETWAPSFAPRQARSEEHTSELQSRVDLVFRLLV